MPFHKIYLATPDFWMIVLYYIGLISIIILFNKKKVRFLKFLLGDGIKDFLKKYWKKLITCFAIIAVIFNIIKIVPQNLKIYFVDVGQRRLLCYKKPYGKKYYY